MELLHRAEPQGQAMAEDRQISRVNFSKDSAKEEYCISKQTIGII